MAEERAGEVTDVRSVGRINREIYKCVTPDIVTDEVVITDKQIEHIIERHPQVFERYHEYFREIIETPDFIVESAKPNTAVVMKELTNNGGEKFKTILRLVTSTDDPAFKNSIITFMQIRTKEWNRLLRNKKILYKRS